MKTGNIILAIFLWLCIPASFIFGGLFGLFGGGMGGGVICAIGAPLIFFILGLIALFTGMEKNHRPSSSQHVVVQQQTIPDRTYHSSVEEKCPICGKSKGSQLFYLVTLNNNTQKVCGECYADIRKQEINKETLITETNKSIDDESLKVLKLRYAKGEITKEQFEQMKKDLND